jgi:hypothetical protein
MLQVWCAAMESAWLDWCCAAAPALLLPPSQLLLLRPWMLS